MKKLMLISLLVSTSIVRGADQPIIRATTVKTFPGSREERLLGSSSSVVKLQVALRSFSPRKTENIDVFFNVNQNKKYEEVLGKGTINLYNQYGEQLSLAGDKYDPENTFMVQSEEKQVATVYGEAIKGSEE